MLKRVSLSFPFLFLVITLAYEDLCRTLVWNHENSFGSFVKWQRLSGPPGMTMDWQGAPASPSSYTVKRILRLEIPVDNYPNVRSFCKLAFCCLLSYLLFSFSKKHAFLLWYHSLILLGDFWALEEIHWNAWKSPQDAVSLLEEMAQ